MSDQPVTNLLQEMKLKAKKEKCPGLVFRGYRSQFMTNGHIGERLGLKLLKRKSCPGCATCAPLLDDAHEFACNGDLQISHIVEGALYRLEYQNLHTDWETGYVDDFDLVAVMLPEEEQDRGKDFHGRYTRRKERT